MNLVLGVMYLLFPMTWFALMGWTGHAISTIANVSMESGVKMSQDAGADGGRKVKGAAGAAISKGKSLK
ncbi:hypothetical protein OX449_002812 [Salmonella enterica]|nr:hypothetical protein [Salmonella enterica]EKF1255577.1 hypothetical protein [Salmonella enterica]